MEIVQEPRAINHLEVLFWPLVICLVIIALVRFRSPKTLLSIFRIAGNNGHMHLHLREGFNVNGISSFLLQFNYFITIGVILYTFYDHYAETTKIEPWILLLCLSGPFLFFLIKYVIVKFFAVITETNQGFFEYLTNYKVFFQVQGLVLLPFAISLLFVGVEARYYLALIAISLIVAFGIYKTVLSFLYAIRYGFSVLYIFLYLCTLEILPLVVIFKLFDDRIL